MQFSDADCREIVRQFWAAYGDNPNIVAVGCFDTDESTMALTVRCLDPRRLGELSSFSVSIRDSQQEVPVVLVESLGFEPAVGLQEDLPAIDETKLSNKAVGGTFISPRGRNFFGTLGVSLWYVKIHHRFSYSHSETCEGTNVLLTNNHVIADYDRLPIGNDIENRNGDRVADLHCFISMDRRDMGVDLALGVYPRRLPDHEYGEIQGLGRMTGHSKPVKNVTVRKSGVMTGVTSGMCKGWEWFKLDTPSGTRRVEGWLVEGPFAARGDSGSAVLHGSTLFGLWFSNEKVRCGNPPRAGHFVGWDYANVAGVTEGIEIRITPTENQ